MLQDLILGKTGNLLCLKNSSQLRKKWQKLGIKKMLAISRICTCSSDPVSPMHLHMLGYLCFKFLMEFRFIGRVGKVTLTDTSY